MRGGNRTFSQACRFGFGLNASLLQCVRRNSLLYSHHVVELLVDVAPQTVGGFRAWSNEFLKGRQKTISRPIVHLFGNCFGKLAETRQIETVIRIARSSHGFAERRTSAARRN